MLDIKLSPPREGTRGGREQFKWEDLKSHDLKDREHYLGHSVKVGLLERKNKFYKHDWYLRKESSGHTESDSKDEKLDEQELTRRYEEEIMQEMLGMKPKRLMLLKSRPTDLKQLAQLLNMGTNTKGNNGSIEVPDSKNSPKIRTGSKARSGSRGSYTSSDDGSSDTSSSIGRRTNTGRRGMRSSSRSRSYDNKYSKSRHRSSRTRDRISKKSISLREDRHTGRGSDRTRSRSPKRGSSRQSKTTKESEKYRIKHRTKHHESKRREGGRDYRNRPRYRDRDGHRRRSRSHDSR
ncbi:hypothetical protein MACJ_002490 [Theileria orientalis]|uniref:Multiple myeloma tumor-associated protein 2-like N-terminal domain-containing protein n=1 Tax=Theileria orientalis TaxID=68886 RepID=A0A976M656_THEOR|nr:hypothetical protein MACJ_002490 [Theileria orientalis]